MKGTVYVAHTYKMNRHSQQLRPKNRKVENRWQHLAQVPRELFKVDIEKGNANK